MDLDLRVVLECKVDQGFGSCFGMQDGVKYLGMFWNASWIKNFWELFWNAKWMVLVWDCFRMQDGPRFRGCFGMQDGSRLWELF